jgi:hypothetical protein
VGKQDRVRARVESKTWRAHPRRGPMKHRPQFEIDGLQRGEGVLDAAETFVGAHCGGGISLRGGQVDADHIDAVERGLGGDAESVFGEAERVVAMLI